MTKVRLLLLLSLIFISGCNEYLVTITPTPTLKPIDANLAEEYATIQLKKVVLDISTGKTIGHTNKSRSNPVVFTTADESFFETCLKKNFYSVLDKKGYKTLGGAEALFDEYENLSADYVVGARIVDIRQNRKQVAQFLDYKLTVEQFIEVRWEVYSRQTKKIVGVFNSKGYHQDSMVFLYNFPSEQILNVVDIASKNAVYNLVADSNFIKILKADKYIVNTNIKKYSIVLPKNYTAPINENSSQIRASVIGIKSSAGMGSGFIISPDGYALTNAHVVSSDSIVNIRLATGRECLADVLYKDFERDVAVLKIERQGFTPLPINSHVINIGDEVYAMGSPLGQESLSNTLTKGIVSAFRNQKGLDYIQSDVSVQPGNSGGPLMDKYGNVVGVTVSGIFIDAASTGLNFFIPINDALKSVGIEMFEGQGHTQ
jgi:serine protease Do